MKRVWKAHTLMTNGNLNEMTNHNRRLELQQELDAGIKQIKKHKNQRRNLRRKIANAVRYM